MVLQKDKYKQASEEETQTYKSRHVNKGTQRE